MNCLIWNIWGLGNQRAFSNLHQLIADEDLSLVFLCETKLVSGQCSNIRARLGFDSCHIEDSFGCKGWLILLWKSPMVIEIQSSSLRHIDVVISHDYRSWRFTGFYGNSVIE